LARRIPGWPGGRVSGTDPFHDRCTSTPLIGGVNVHRSRSSLIFRVRWGQAGRGSG
jgi:hypothetical protein